VTVAADVLLGLAVLAALIDWWGVARERLSVEFTARPLVVIALVGTALAIDTDVDVARGLVIAALGASLVGDVVMTAPDARYEAGLMAFLVGHVLTIAAFVESIQGSLVLGVALLPIGIGIGVAPQIIEGARQEHPVVGALAAVYVVVVGAVATMAAGTGLLVAAIGGALFLASGWLLLWNRYVAPAPGGRLLVHVTEHLARVALVLWLAVA